VVHVRNHPISSALAVISAHVLTVLGFVAYDPIGQARTDAFGGRVGREFEDHIEMVSLAGPPLPAPNVADGV
jgi:hypothetical protein